jgi:hypothetical protein
MAWTRQMRVKFSGELGLVYPETAQLLIDHLSRRCDDRGLLRLQFQVGGLPISLNHQYKDGLSFCKPGTAGAFQDKAGRWRVRNHQLRPEALDWRVVLSEAMGPLRHKWKPTGTTAALLLFETPHWLTGRRTVREMDVDNKVKPALDAVQHATDVPDELHFQIHAFKLLSKRQRTTVFLFDLGDVIEYFF